MIVSLLASLLVDRSAASRARAQELAGRLGLRAARPVPGTLARLRWIDSQYGPVVRQAVELVLVMSGEAARPLRSGTWEYHLGWGADTPRGASRRSWTTGERLFCVQHDGFRLAGLGDPACHFAVPDPGVRTELDPLLPWFAQLAARAMAATTWTEIYFLFGGADTVLPPHWDRLVGTARERELFARPEDPLAPDPPRGRGAAFPLRDRDERAWATGALIALRLDDQLRDYLRFEPPADLMSMTWADARDRAAAWHRRFIDAAGRGTPVRPGITIVTWPDGDRIDRLVTAEQLAQEGESMGHCVGGYWPQVREGRSVILSYRGADGVPAATAEVQVSREHPGPLEVSLTQIVGPEDADIDDQDEQLVRRFREVLSLLGIEHFDYHAPLVVPDIVVEAAERGVHQIADWGAYRHRESGDRGDVPDDYDLVRTLLFAMGKVGVGADTRDGSWDLAYELRQPGAEESWPIRAADLGVDLSEHPTATAYAESLDFWAEEGDREFWEGLPEVMHALSDLGTWRFVVSEMGPGEAPGRGVTGWVLAWMDAPGDAIVGSLIWFQSQGGDAVIRAYLGNSLEEDGLRAGDFSQDDRSPMRALYHAGLLVTAAEAARALAAERQAPGAAVLLYPASAVLQPPAVLARAAVARGVDPDPDVRRLLRGED